MTIGPILGETTLQLVRHKALRGATEGAYKNLKCLRTVLSAVLPPDATSCRQLLQVCLRHRPNTALMVRAPRASALPAALKRRQLHRPFQSHQQPRSLTEHHLADIRGLIVGAVVAQQRGTILGHGARLRIRLHNVNAQVLHVTAIVEVVVQSLLDGKLKLRRNQAQ